jgi:hypothetical protein
MDPQRSPETGVPVNPVQVRCLIAWAAMSVGAIETGLILRFFFEGRYG